MKDYKLIILGGGAAGFAAAIRANEFQVKTLMVNNKTVGTGGTCVNAGCLPTKHLLHVARVIHDANTDNLKGLNASASFDFKTIIEEKDKLIERLRQEKYEKVLISLTHVEFIEGDARFLSQSEIQIGREIYKADKFVLATGSSTFIPQIEGIDSIDYLTNIEALKLKEFPSSVIILGGGPLGIEFAQMFSRFGTEVHLLQRSGRIVPREEPELSGLLQKYLQDEGIEIRTDAEIKSIKEKGEEKIVNAVFGEKEESFRGEKLLMATGRRPNTSNLGLESLGIQLGRKGEIVVNDEMQAGENVWAAGDVTGEPMLETVAAREGMIAASNALSQEKVKMDYRVVPHAVFTDPQLAGVGLTDEQAIGEGIRCRCNTVSLESVPKAQAIRNTKGAIKVVIDDETQKIIGIHILASAAADLIHEGVMIVKNRMRVDDVIDTMHVFPTLSEGVKIAAQSFRRDITKMSCCVE